MSVVGRRDHDVGGEGVLQQTRVRLERRGEEHLARDEHDHELRRGVERAPVGLRGERVDVRAQLPGVGEGPLAAPGVVGRLERLQVGLARHLGVDHHLLAAREVHDEVGALRGALARPPRTAC